MDITFKNWTRYLLEHEYDSSRNCVCSPYSLIVLLALLVNGASKETRAEILEAVNNEDITQLNDYLHEVSGIIAQDDTVTESNAVCIRGDYEEHILDRYKTMIKDAFGAEIFTSTGDRELVNLVNNWVNEKTLGMIPYLVEELDEGVKAVLMNAVAFMGTWLEEYEDDDIRHDVTFTNIDQTKSKVTMLSHDLETYVEDSSVIGFIKEYDGFNYSFMGILPKQEGEEAMKDAIKSLDIASLYRNSMWGNVSTMIPEFEVSTDCDLTSLCMDRGIKRAFTDEAQFDSLTDCGDLKIDSVLQKAYIKVDRKGTKAAVVTAALMRCMCAMPVEDAKMSIILDRPFIYAIVNNDTGIPVFTGVVNRM